MNSSVYHEVSPQPDVIFIWGEIYYTFSSSCSRLFVAHTAPGMSQDIRQMSLQKHAYTHAHTSSTYLGVYAGAGVFVTYPCILHSAGFSAPVSTGNVTHSHRIKGLLRDQLLLELIIHVGLQVAHFCVMLQCH